MDRCAPARRREDGGCIHRRRGQILIHGRASVLDRGRPVFCPAIRGRLRSTGFEPGLCLVSAQFENIGQLKAQYLTKGEPVISIDTKKKELIGNFARDGHTHTQAQVQTLDHDFPSAGDGKLIPHGLYDLARNEG